MTVSAVLKGAKKGKKKPRQPVEHPDTARSVAYARVLLALADGEVDPEITGKNILLDGTPILDEQGNENIPGVKWEFRPGTPHQLHIAGMPVVENEIGLGVELKSDSPFVKNITNTQLSAIRLRFSWPQLYEQLGNGDVVGYKIVYAIDIAIDDGNYQEVGSYVINDKVTTEYQRSHRIELPKALTGWRVRVRRLTPNKVGGKVADTMQIISLAEIVDAKLRYPHTALLFLEFDSAHFSGTVPTVSVRKKWKLIRVPSNYDSIARTYDGVWDGSFVWAYTNNPAWIWYDLVLSERYGLGRWIKASQVDKWSVYRIARYCDELVPNGKGGMEPRHTFDCVFNDRNAAWSTLRDIAAAFNGMTYWNGAQIALDADMPRAVEYVYTNADVKDGQFQYGSQKANTKHSIALVSYSNPDNHYEQEPVVVSDDGMIRRYGINQVEVTAIGTTRESEAQRRGKQLLLTNKFDRSISFVTGLEGKIPVPGMVVAVADEKLAGRSIGGRISAVSGRKITLDREVSALVGDRLKLNLPSGRAEARTISGIKGRVVTVNTVYSEEPNEQAVWVLEPLELKLQQYRVLRVKRASGSIEHTIEGIQYEPSKFEHVEHGARLDERPITVRPPSVQVPPKNVVISSFSTVHQGQAVTTLRVQWEQVEGAIAYEALWRKDNGDWVAVPRTSSLGFEVTGVYAGKYVAQVRAVNAVDVLSLPSFSEETLVKGKQGTPPHVAFLKTESLVFGIKLNWGFPVQGALDTERTELQYKAQSNEEVLSLGSFAYPANTHTLTGLGAGQIFNFRARLVDRSGNIGPWSNWISGESSAKAEEILDYLSGEINETHLGKHLNEKISSIDQIDEHLKSVEAGLQQTEQLLHEKIDSIDALEYGLKDLDVAIQETEKQLGVLEGSVDTKLEIFNKELEEQLFTLKEEIESLEQSGLYDAEIEYLASEVVLYEGAVYKAKKVTKGNLPTDTVFWEKIGDYSSIDNLVGALASQLQVITQKVSQQGEEIATQSGSITKLSSSLKVANEKAQQGIDDAKAAKQLAETKADAAAVAALDTKVTQQGQDIASQSNSLTKLTADLKATDSKAQQGITDAAAAKKLANTKADATAVAALDTKVTKQGQDIASQSSSLTKLTADLKIMDGKAEQGIADAAAAKKLAGTKADAAVVQALDTRVTQQGQDIASQSQSVTSLKAAIDALPNTGVNLLGAEASMAATMDGTSMFNASRELLEIGSGVGVLDAALKFKPDTADKVALFRYSRSANTWANIEEEKNYIISAYVFSPINKRLQILGVMANSETNPPWFNRYPAETSERFSEITGGEWTRVSAVVNAPKDAVILGMTIYINEENSPISEENFLLISRVMVEQQVGDNRTPSPWVPGKADAVLNANASALAVLDAQVTQQGKELISQSGSITKLSSDLKVVDDKAQQGVDDATAAKALAETKADATAVQALNTKVIQQGEKIASQSSSLTKLTADLKATDSKAQQGIADAAAAKKLAGTKADAAAVQALDTQVTQQGEKIASQSSSLTKLTADLKATDSKAQQGIADAAAAKKLAGTKADAAAVQALDTQVAQQGEKIASQSSSLTKLTADLKATDGKAQQGIADAAAAKKLADTKADAAAVQALDTKVTQQGQDIASQSQSVTSLKAAIDALPNTGVNLLGAEASMAATMDGTSTAYASRELLEIGAGVGALDVALKFKPNTEEKVALFRYARSANTWANIEEEKNYIISAYVFSPINKRLQILGVTASSEEGSRTWLNRYPVETSERFPEITGGEWTRVSAVVDAPKNSAILGILIYINEEKSPISEENFLLISRVMVEQQIGDNRTPSPWVPGKADAVLNANASALAVLDAQVTQQGKDILSQGRSLTEISVKANKNTAAIQQVSSAQASTSGKLSVMHSVKLAVTADGRYYAAGMGIGIENTPSGMQSQMLFSADRFAFFNNANGKAVSPAVIQGGNIYLNNAFIQNATITSAKIADSAITSAKIANASITSVKIANASISSAKIGNAAVDTLKIAGRAVTLPYSVIISSQYIWNVSPNQWREIARLVVRPSGATANISCSVESYIVSGGDVWARMRLRRLEGNKILWSVGGHVGLIIRWGEAVISSFTVEDSYSGSTATYVLEMVRDRDLFNQGAVGTRSITYTEFKR
ncbi:phage tail protein [Thiopseudomonas alkaliphila]|uniref:phage tail protein n=1 Tax=Thiopseudomonas alkaliphila TaxID=1697053 RepID=UPI00069CE9F9|nr:phage tail protein [Thiopseudomonas alkaliphila]